MIRDFNRDACSCRARNASGHFLSLTGEYSSLNNSFLKIPLHSIERFQSTSLLALSNLMGSINSNEIYRTVGR